MNRIHNPHHPSSAFRHSCFHFTPFAVLLTLFSLVSMLLCTPAVVFSQQRWWRTYGGPNCEWGNSVVQTSDTGYAIVGWTNSFGALDTDVYFLKTNASGDTLWTRRYGGSHWDEGSAIQQTQDGGYIIAGSTRSYGLGVPDSSNFYLIKTNAYGDTQWTRAYGGVYTELGQSVKQTTDGGYIVVGYTWSFGSWVKIYLVKTNASGDTLWTKRLGWHARDWGLSVEQTKDGCYIIAGETDNFGFTDVYLIKTTSSGDTLWTRTYGGASNDGGACVYQTSDSGYIVVGVTYSGDPDGDVYLIKTNSFGDTLWTKTYGGPRYDMGMSVQQTTDGGYISTGITESFGVNSDVYLVKVDSSGSLSWFKNFGGTNGEKGYSIQQTRDGGYIISGRTGSFGAGLWDVYLIKTDANGNVGTERGQGFEGSRARGYKITPNPFITFTTVPGHEAERFSLYDISGRKVGTYKGGRIGEGLTPGVYFLRRDTACRAPTTAPLRIVKLR